MRRSRPTTTPEPQRRRGRRPPPAARHSLAAALLLWTGAACAGDPPAPDYAQPDAWAAWPGRPGTVDAVPAGVPEASVPEAQKADVFFIHPTTYLEGTAANARYDEPGTTSTQIDQGVLRFQASVFNACCRIYAPHYRQASIRAFWGYSDAQATAAFDLAYADVLRAFDFYMAHENHGRPFIIASHSQGSLHALRLVQERLAGQPLRAHLVAAYIVGYAVPLELEKTGLPLCRSATQTGCVIDWNTVKQGTSAGEHEHRRFVWIEGTWQHVGTRDLACTNPLNWELGGAAPASTNLGAVPGVHADAPMPRIVPQLTGAVCSGPLLEVSIPLDARQGFSNVLTAFGSYHILDYNLFYTNIRVNARDRVLAFAAAPP